MGSNFLKSFLETGLFDIGDSDERLSWLQQSIDDLQKKFEKDYSLLPKYSLVSLDPNISDNEPVLIETEEIVTNYWKALRGKYPEMPRNILRGVILNALNNIGNTDPVAARIIYLTASNYYPFAKLNNEKNLVEEMLVNFGELAEENAIEDWSIMESSPSFKLGTLKLNALKFGNATLKADDLESKLNVAVKVSPQNQGPQHGGESSWGAHFSEKASEGIVEAFNEAIKGLVKSLSPDSIETPINKFLANFKKTLDSNLKETFSSLTAVERRSKLLWWKETLYSHSQKKSYRDIDSNLLPIVMSIDLNNQVSEITPISVDFLLKDTLFILNDKNDEAMKFNDFFKVLSNDSFKEILKPYFTELNEDDGRISMTDFIALLVNDRLSVNDFKKRTGINEDEVISQAELSVSILHDLLSQRLVKE